MNFNLHFFAKKFDFDNMFSHVSFFCIRNLLVFLSCYFFYKSIFQMLAFFYEEIYKYKQFLLRRILSRFHKILFLLLKKSTKFFFPLVKEILKKITFYKFFCQSCSLLNNLFMLSE